MTHDVQIMASAPGLLLDAPSLPSVLGVRVNNNNTIRGLVSVLPSERAVRSSDGAGLACFKGWYTHVFLFLLWCVAHTVPVTEISCTVSRYVLTAELSL